MIGDVQRTSFGEMRCSIAQTLEVIGEWWTPLILRDIALGVSRFDEIQRNLGISRKVLAQRLETLLEHGVVRREQYSQRPPRYDYFLTEKGADLGAVLLALQAWGDKWVFGDEGPPVRNRHERCGGFTELELRCTCCGEPLHPLEITPVGGPGAHSGPGTTEIPAALERLRRLRAGEPVPPR